MKAIITTIEEEFQKAAVKPFTRTRRGRMERVKGFERKGRPGKFSIGEKVIVDFPPEKGEKSHWTDQESGKIIGPEKVVLTPKEKEQVRSGKAYMVDTPGGARLVGSKNIYRFKDYGGLRAFRRTKS